ncbi:hypothetical protein CTI12_AA379850 [Artemisia annua]|uniref:Ubiquitin-like protease family profile domain-containing protein n=1 Tax=Artemisia annua TaxID=35608 RepID=A0A2U1MHZ8_ARTAN|nr:hypothetical protein CTI12_AA379850 [Artemisia annua]
MLIILKHGCLDVSIRCALLIYVYYLRTLGSKRKGKEIAVGKAYKVVEKSIYVDQDDDFVDSEWNNSGLRRSGRKKGNVETEGGKDGTGSSGYKDDHANIAVEREIGVIAKRKKEDTIGDEVDAVKKIKRKKGETSKAVVSKPYVFQTRTSPKMLFNALQTLRPVQKACVEQMGFGGMLDMKLDGIPSKMGFYVVDNFNPETMELKVNNHSIVITKQLIGELLGIRNEGRDIMDAEIEKDEVLIGSWLQQFQEGKEKNTGILKGLIRKSKVADMNFKLNFIVLFTSLMGGVKGKGICDESVLKHIDTETDFSTINWCDYVLRCLKTCKEGWNREMSNSYFLGPLSLLTMAYVDGTVCDGFNVPRVRPATRFWTYELLKERETEEINTVGLGKGELQGPYIEEDVDPMPEDEEGFTWKLNKVVEIIRMQRKCFEKTLDAGLGMFPGNLLMTDLSQQYRAALKITESVDEVDVSKKKDGKDVTNDDPFESPEFVMGPSTQMEVFRASDKECAKYYGEQIQWDMEVPNFSIGLTQDPAFATQKDANMGNVETPNQNAGNGKESLSIASTSTLSPMKAVPISSCKPKVVREKRVCSKAVTMVSPFVSRVLDIDSRFTNEEKLVDAYLLNSDGIEFNDVLFETATGEKVTFAQLMTLVGGENIDNCVVDAWSTFLNSLEEYKDPASNSRFYLPTFDVDKNEFTSETRAGCMVLNYFANVEMLASRAGKTHMFNDVDIVFIPVSNGDHKFVVCFNIKNPAVMVFDNKKVSNPTDKETMRVATIMQKKFANFMRSRIHEKAFAILKSVITRGEFHWQTDRRPTDCGVFVMRHMEHYMGNNILRWDCGIEDEGRKQTNQLVKLRKKYAARLLLSDCNMKKDKIVADMMKFRDANADVKKRKVSVRGV